jgi:hypothetical protein
MSTLTIPHSILAEFGQPDFWAVTVIDASSPDVEHWRTLGYTGALRNLENAIKAEGKDIHSGEWRIYELQAGDVEAIIDAMRENGLDEDLADVKIVLAVARGVA